MKPIKLITALAAVWCIVVSSARAQNITNAATFTAVAYEEGSITTNSSGTTTYAMVKQVYNTALLLEEINSAVTTNKFSSAAKLVLIVTTNNVSAPSFAVIDGTNFYDLSPAGYNIIEPGAGDPVRSGTVNNATLQRKLTEADFYSIYYKDTGTGTGSLPLTGKGSLEFYLEGLWMFTQSGTATNRAGASTETYKASAASLTGEGQSGTNYFFMTGMVSAATASARQ